MLEKIFLHQQQYALELRKHSLGDRLEALSKLESLIANNQSEILEALAQDFKKPETETLMTEILPTLHEIRYVKKNLKKWMKDQKVPTPFTLLGTKSYIRHEARGVCLIIGPWNYPFQLIFAPLIAALAAGNTAIIKPSEYSRFTSALISRLITANFSAEYVTVIQGGTETTQDLLKLPFDHIFFTGSTRVGQIVMEAASKHLSTVTLELGGKSPTIVDSTADIEKSAEKIAWAKFLNAGQTCVAPDYILVQESIYSEFKEALIKAIQKFYGSNDEDIKNNPDFARIISLHHATRLSELIQKAEKENAVIAFGGKTNNEDRYVSPTLLEKVDVHSDVMKEEIFGPILPLQTFKEIHEVVHFINERSKPLALYMFSNSKHNLDMVLSQTSSGGVCINDCLLHVANYELPFGGVGASGMGNYHGYHGFKTFSHQKSVLRKTWLGKMTEMLYPPYGGTKLKLLKKMI